ncbi:hypothetical protein [Halorarius litoreus]|uniref:hypothetical protein n=1 Tax=Halorarius litoreus TaxID=2962676 RepID=UPI0020CC4930|nr:hypothetical protein [Halorarius litoreus]
MVRPALHPGRYPLSWPVAVPLAAMLGVWLLVDTGVMTSDLAAVLYPAVLPWYVSSLAASALRNLALPWLGSGLLFHTVAFTVMCLEALLLGGIYTVFASGVRSLRRGDPAA